MNPPGTPGSASREKVRCVHCDSEMERRNLKSHTLRVHAGKSPCEKPSAGQRTLSFSVKTLKRVASGNDNEGEKRARLDDVEGEPSDPKIVGDLEIELPEDNYQEDITNREILREVQKSKEIILECIKDKIVGDTFKKVGDTVVPEEKKDDIGYKLSKARSIVEVAECYSELKFLERMNMIYCDLCVDKNKVEHLTEDDKVIGIIKTNGIDEPRDENDVQSRSFLNLKKKVTTHIATQIHKNNIQNLKQQNFTNKKDPASRNNSDAGMRCARICYELFKMGRPYTDYPEMVALFVKGGVFMGDTNHSTEYPAHFLKSVADVVRAKIKEVLNKPLKQTGHVRPCKVIADKDTTKHRTRQLICLTTVFPEAKDLIQTIYIDHPLIRHHKTEDVAENIVKSVKDFISDESYAGGSYDGAYFHAKKDIPQHVNEAFHVEDEKVHNDHDAMHRSGLAEKRARKKNNNEWVNKLGEIL